MCWRNVYFIFFAIKANFTRNKKLLRTSNEWKCYSTSHPITLKISTAACASAHLDSWRCLFCFFRRHFFSLFTRQLIANLSCKGKKAQLVLIKLTFAMSTLLHNIAWAAPLSFQFFKFDSRRKTVNPVFFFATPWEPHKMLITRNTFALFNLKTFRLKLYRAEKCVRLEASFVASHHDKQAIHLQTLEEIELFTPQKPFA